MRPMSWMVMIGLSLTGCGSTPESFPAVNDAMTCAEVVEVIDTALQRGQRFVAGQESDAVLAADLVFALSGAEARPECVDADTRSRAAGMRATITGTTR